MEFLVELATTFWQFTVLAILILIGFAINLLDKEEEVDRVGFKYKELPTMKPLPIPTKGKGFWGGIWIWLTTVRTWEIAKDWHYTLNKTNYVVPKGFVFDGASVPKFLATFLSPVGVLLMGGLVHDYAYKYAALLKKGTAKENATPLTQKEADIIFRDICIEVNGFKLLNYLAYYTLRLAGFVAWNGHRKNDIK